tara:strand:+ start:924 stop:1661 length:738 start_codon:yes stop_codon:yes gene_type:complete
MENNYQSKPFIALSHRGDSNDYVENSFEAFKSVVDMGFEYIETDLRKTSDDKIIAFHDEDLKRLFNIDLKVENLTFKEIDKFFSKKNCKLLTLKETLINFPETKFNIDLKIEGVIQESISIVKELKAFDRVCFASFSSSHTDKVLKDNPKAIVSMGMKDVAYLKFFNYLRKDSKILQVPLNWKGVNIVNSKLIQKAKEKDLFIHVWTINDRETIVKLIEMGVHGIVTDKPDLIKDVMKEKNLIFS